MAGSLSEWGASLATSPPDVCGGQSPDELLGIPPNPPPIPQPNPPASAAAEAPDDDPLEDEDEELSLGFGLLQRLPRVNFQRSSPIEESPPRRQASAANGVVRDGEREVEGEGMDEQGRSLGWGDVIMPGEDDFPDDERGNTMTDTYIQRYVPSQAFNDGPLVVAKEPAAPLEAFDSPAAQNDGNEITNSMIMTSQYIAQHQPTQGFDDIQPREKPADSELMPPPPPLFPSSMPESQKQEEPSAGNILTTQAIAQYQPSPAYNDVDMAPPQHLSSQPPAAHSAIGHHDDQEPPDEGPSASNLLTTLAVANYQPSPAYNDVDIVPPLIYPHQVPPPPPPPPPQQLSPQPPAAHSAIRNHDDQEPSDAEHGEPSASNLLTTIAIANYQPSPTYNDVDIPLPPSPRQLSPQPPAAHSDHIKDEQSDRHDNNHEAPHAHEQPSADVPLRERPRRLKRKQLGNVESAQAAAAASGEGEGERAAVGIQGMSPQVGPEASPSPVDHKKAEGDSQHGDSEEVLDLGNEPPAERQPHSSVRPRRVVLSKRSRDAAGSADDAQRDEGGGGEERAASAAAAAAAGGGGDGGAGGGWGSDHTSVADDSQQSEEMLAYDIGGAGRDPPGHDSSRPLAEAARKGGGKTKPITPKPLATSSSAGGAHSSSQGWLTKKRAKVTPKVAPLSLGPSRSPRNKQSTLDGFVVRIDKNKTEEDGQQGR
ncbi:unnamed protein product [Vitrella brassicaformis CCMP3155]|uniref:Uncharacterized protein n=1 Tax=Vitrella brassicaformis (strain CCMP3155) TaxID=1169540 RepID=A0A0G4EHR8_VITBC|nr:unnamed protein product [Vitrella brassicaformis CCMP3155]|eukprot:CEL95528.1 unnamed protein product [Vitrella brassicaformis CCMP3155]